MPRFQSSPFEHGQPETLGILVVNLGTPAAPTPSAVRRFLAQFLWDPRVIELPRPLWWLILHGVILRIRPARSARAYAKIWTDGGSPLLLYSQALTEKVGVRLKERLSGENHVVLGMSYGEPSIPGALRQLHDKGVRRLIVLPVYPQYSGTTTASVFDAVTRELRRRRWVPELRFVNQYHDEKGYVAALVDSIRTYWEQQGRGDKLLFSFHGVPKQTLLDGDPYHCQCQKTARLVAEKLDLSNDDWQLTFQSRVGRAEWLRPYTDETIRQLGAQKLGRLDVVCPGFAADCLETLEEIAIQNGESFVESGGGQLNYIPALNDSDTHVAFLADLLLQHMSGWPETKTGALDNESERLGSRERALAMGAAQ